MKIPSRPAGFRGPKSVRFSARFLAPLALSASMVFLVSCEDDDGMSPQETYLARTISLCEASMTRGQLIELLDGNLSIAASVSEQGYSAADMVGGLIVGFMLNTLDFQALDRWNTEFSGGRYRVRNGVNTLDFHLVFHEAFGDYQPGDTLKQNIFAPSSYVRNVSADLSGVTYDKGPLFSLISGNISWSGTKPRFRLDVTRLTLGVVSDADWTLRWSKTEVDTIRVRMASFPLDLNVLKSDFEHGQVGFSYDSTRFNSPSLKLDQEIYQSGFFIKPIDAQGKGWSWEGEYRNRLDKVFSKTNAALRLYIRGTASTVHGNRATYYCDENLTDSIGNSVHDNSLEWGYFKSVNGDSIPYGLVPATK
jgi:hypothetical protein